MGDGGGGGGGIGVGQDRERHPAEAQAPGPPGAEGTLPGAPGTGFPGEPPALDWNQRWKAAAARRWERDGSHRRYWNRRAPSFGARSPDSTYVRAFVEIMAPEPAWTVLDVGCGAGALAVPLAAKVRQVTAVDFCEGMIRQLDQRIAALGLANVRTLTAAWEDDWDRLGLGTYDAAIASRSLVVEDLAAALVKLDRAARRRVLITSVVGDGPRDRRVLEAVGRVFRPGPDYIYVYNLLHQMGIYANVRLIDARREWTFARPAEAASFYEAYLEDLDPDERTRLDAYLARELVLRDGRWALRHRDVVQWAVIWWDKPPDGPSR
jgi:SAM-dependent methyltransferase